MKSKQVGYVLMALIAIGIVGLVLKIVTSGSNELVLNGLLPISEDVVDGIEIKFEGSQIRLDRVGDEPPFGWRVGRDQVFAPKLDQFWGVVGGIDGAQLVARNPVNHERMGVLDDQGTEVSFLLGDFEQEKFIIGNWTPEVRLCYVRRAGTDDVYGVPCAAPNVFDPNPDGWRNPVVMAIPNGEVESVTFTYPGEEFTIRRSDRQWVIDDGTPEGTLANIFAVQSVLRSIEVFVASGFATEEEAAGLDFNGPNAFSVQIVTMPDSAFPTSRVRLLPRDQATVYAKTPVQSTVFIMDVQTVTALLLSTADLTAQ